MAPTYAILRLFRYVTVCSIALEERTRRNSAPLRSQLGPPICAVLTVSCVWTEPAFPTTLYAMEDGTAKMETMKALSAKNFRNILESPLLAMIGNSRARTILAFPKTLSAMESLIASSAKMKVLSAQLTLLLHPHLNVDPKNSCVPITIAFLSGNLKQAGNGPSQRPTKVQC